MGGGGGQLDTGGMMHGFQALGQALWQAREGRRQRELQGADLDLSSTEGLADDDPARIAAVQRANEVRTRWVPGWTGFPSKTVGAVAPRTIKGTPATPGTAPAPQDINTPEGGVAAPTGAVAGTPDRVEPGSAGHQIMYAPGNKREMSLREYGTLMGWKADDPNVQTLLGQYGDRPISAIPSEARAALTSRLTGGVDPQTAWRIEQEIDRISRLPGPVKGQKSASEREVALQQFPTTLRSMFPNLSDQTMNMYTTQVNQRAAAVKGTEEAAAEQVAHRELRQNAQADLSQADKLASEVRDIERMGRGGSQAGFGKQYDEAVSRLNQFVAGAKERYKNDPELLSRFSGLAVYSPMNPKTGLSETGSNIEGVYTRMEAQRAEAAHMTQLREERMNLAIQAALKKLDQGGSNWQPQNKPNERGFFTLLDPKTMTSKIGRYNPDGSVDTWALNEAEASSDKDVKEFAASHGHAKTTPEDRANSKFSNLSADELRNEMRLARVAGSPQAANLNQLEGEWKRRGYKHGVDEIHPPGLTTKDMEQWKKNPTQIVEADDGSHWELGKDGTPHEVVTTTKVKK